VAFALAAACGRIATWLLPYRVTPPDTITEMLTERWQSEERDVRNFVATQDVTTITGLRNGNDTKARG
jgi:hypothetical protein